MPLARKFATEIQGFGTRTYGTVKTWAVVANFFFQNTSQSVVDPSRLPVCIGDTVPVLCAGATVLIQRAWLFNDA